jgi:SAM-dependent methyltransferase
MAADRGASVAGIDAADPLIRIAAERTPEGDFRVGDLEALPWIDDRFDLVTGFSSFQFADDKVRALQEARRVSRGRVVAVVPSHVPDSGIAQVFKPLFPLFPPDALEGMKESGMFSLSEPGKLDAVLASAGLRVRDDIDQECPIAFSDVDTATRAFVGAGPMQLAIELSGETTVTDAVRAALRPFTGDDGRITLPGWYRITIADG